MKWVDVNKETAENPNVRCRFVARDFKKKGENDPADLFASQRLTKRSSARADGSDRS